MRFLPKDKVTRTILVISDLHLGAGAIVNGQRNSLEDFHYDKELVEFLDYYSSGEYAQREVELIINGDFFDFLAVPYVNYFEDQFWSENASAEKLKMIMGAHPEVLDALIKFCSQKKKRIVYILGNHDAELAFPSLQKTLHELFAPEAQKNFFLLAEEEYSPEEGVFLIHGHQYELAHNYHPQNSIIEDEKGTKYFLPPWGSYYVIKIINRFKRYRYHINAVRPIRKFLINGLIYDTLMTVRFMLSSFFYFLMVRFIYYFKQTSSLKEFTSALKLELQLFENYETLTEDFFKKNKDARVLLVGHTHEPIFRAFDNDKIFINTGSWTKMHHLDFEKQNPGPCLTYAQIDIEKRAKKKSKRGPKGNSKGSPKENPKENPPLFHNIELNVWQGKNNLPYRSF